MPLFPDKIRTDLTYASTIERSYSFLNRSGIEKFGIVRGKLNIWFGHYPEPEQYELKRRMQSKEQFSDAFFELYMHEFFFSKGFHLSVHPKLESTSKQPDFWIEKGNELKFYLEAKVTHDESDEERNYQKKQKNIADELNKLDNFPYWITIRHLKLKNESSFSVKPVLTKIRETVKTFDYFQMIEPNLEESLSFEDENMHLELDFWPRKSSLIEGMNPAVGVYAYFDAGIVNTSESMSKAIEDKARKYGKQNHPFVIALNVSSPTLFSFDDLELLIGKDLQFIRSNKPLGQIDRKLYNEGIFSNHFMDHIAALFILWVTPYHLDDEQWYWCENPNFKDKKFQMSLINQIF